MCRVRVVLSWPRMLWLEEEDGFCGGKEEPCAEYGGGESSSLLRSIFKKWAEVRGF
jgi:hypothetical protein